MADKLVPIADLSTRRDIVLRFVDNGDGTYSEAVSGGGGGGGGGATATQITDALSATNANMEGSLQNIAADTTALASTVVNKKLLIGGARDKWRDGFETLVTDRWDYVTGKAPNDAIVLAGNTSASGFAEAVMDASAINTVTSIRGLQQFAAPYRLGYGMSVSQRQYGEAVVITVAEVDANGQRVITPGETEGFFSAPMIANKISVTSNVAVMTFTAAHTIKHDDLIIVSGCVDQRMNVQARVTQVRGRFAVVFPLTYANGNYPVTATVHRFCPSKGSLNCAGTVLMDNLDANGIPFSRGQGSPEFLSANTSLGTSYSAALIPSAQPYTINLQPRFVTELIGTMDVQRWLSSAIDSAVAGVALKRTQAVPDPSKNYAMFVDVVAFPNRQAPIEILSVVKTGTTTATVNTVNPHGLATGAVVHGYGSRDQTTLPNITNALATVTGPSQLQFTWGTAVTQTYHGGMLMPSNPMHTVPGAMTTAIMGTSWYNGRLYIGTFSVAPFTMGDIVRLVGVRDTTGALRPNMGGRFRVVAISPNIQEAGISTGASTTSASPTLVMTETGAVPIGAILSGSGLAAASTVNAVTANTSVTLSVNATATATQLQDITLQGVVLEPIEFVAPANHQPTTVISAGAIVKETSVRLNMARCLDYTRTPVEITGGHTTQDAQQAVPVLFAAGTTVTAAQGSVAAIGTGGLGAWLIRAGAHTTADIASAALTAVGATTSAAIDLLGNTGSMGFNVDATAVGGSLPRLITRVQGSFDNANFVNVYDIGVVTNITALGKNNDTPIIPVEFRSIRYVRDLRGTTPSVTHSVTRTVRPMEASRRQRRMIDRLVALTSTTPSTEWLYVAGCTRAQMMCTPVTGLTGSPVLKAQLCQGDPTIASNWYDIPSAPTLAPSVSATVSTADFAIGHAKFARLVPTTAATAATAETYELVLTAWE